MSYVKKDADGRSYMVAKKTGKKLYLKERPKSQPKKRGNKYV